MVRGHGRERLLHELLLGIFLPSSGYSFASSITINVINRDSGLVPLIESNHSLENVWYVSVSLIRTETSGHMTAI